MEDSSCESFRNHPTPPHLQSVFRCVGWGQRNAVRIQADVVVIEPRHPSQAVH
jgi:hypothetical protein